MDQVQEKRYSEQFLKDEIRRTNPDYVVYAPRCNTGASDHGNEHFHVFRAKDDHLCALWTMSYFEGSFTQRPMFSKSYNGGLTWTDPVCLLKDPIDPQTGKNMGSWATAAISKSGRIYVIYSKHIGKSPSHEQGLLYVLYSDDAGETWSDEAPLQNIPRSKFDPSDASEAPNGLPWQRAIRLKNDTVLLGITRNRLHDGVPPSPHPGIYMEHPCACEFIRFDNIDDDPEPLDLKVTFLAFSEDWLSAPLPGHPECRSGEEPSFCELPDGRLMCVFRTGEGHIWYSISADSGVTWTQAEMLRYTDNGPGIEHPLSPCPFFPVSDKGEFVLFAHCSDGYNGTDRPRSDYNWRNPVYIMKGEFRPDAHQPVWFSDPVEFMNNGDVSISRKDLAMYSDLTIEDGEPVFWYPDRKFFLLGRRLTKDLLESMSVPAQ